MLAAGALSASAWAGPAQPKAGLSAVESALAKNFDSMDLNKDGVLDKSEILAAIKINFDMVDANRDGQISLEEFVAHQEVAARSNGVVREDVLRLGRAHMKFQFELQDRDKDGKLSFEEFAADIYSGTLGFDENKDGKVSRAEWLAGQSSATAAEGFSPKARAPEGKSLLDRLFDSIF